MTYRDDDGLVDFEVTNWDETTYSGDIVWSTHPHHPEGAFFTCERADAEVTA